MVIFSRYYHFLVFLFIAVSSIIFSSAYANTSPGEASCYVAATNKTYTCHVGKGGIVADKKEGDGATPAGSFVIREIFYRPDKLNPQQIDRLKAMQTKGFPVHALTTEDGWSDDVSSPFYNEHILIADYLKQPLANPSYEKLWRDDDVYNIIAVVGYNDNPVVKGKGSAIFMHVQHQTADGILPTVGCISFAQNDLIDVLTALTPKSHIQISAQNKYIVIR